MSSDAPHTSDPADRVTSISCKCPLKLDNNRRCQNTTEFWWYVLKAGVTVDESWINVISNLFLPSPQERTWSRSVYPSHSDLVSLLTKFKVHPLPMRSLSAYLHVWPFLLPFSSQSQFSMAKISFLFPSKALSRYFLQLLSHPSFPCRWAPASTSAHQIQLLFSPLSSSMSLLPCLANISCLLLNQLSDKNNEKPYRVLENAKFIYRASEVLHRASVCCWSWSPWRNRRCPRGGHSRYRRYRLLPFPGTWFGFIHKQEKHFTENVHSQVA